MNVVVTGGHGFLGWHTSCRLRAQHDIETVRLGRAELADPQRLTEEVGRADVVLHLAGVNRAADDDAVRLGNIHVAEQLAAAVVARTRPLRLVYANSIQADRDTAYGKGKGEAARILRAAVAHEGGSMADVMLPNVFGEHGRPHYNSFVATFCRELADGDTPTVLTDDEVPLLHAQTAAQHLIDAFDGAVDETVHPEAGSRRVSAVLEQLRSIHELYTRGQVPPLTDDFSVDLFNTYRSFTFPKAFPLHPEVHADERGELFETVRSHGGAGQAFVSTTRPGATRGNHYHLRKVERFFVVRGRAEIALRRLLDDEVVTYRLDGERPGFVDMPTMWVHNITNVGEEDLVTMFWSDQLLEPDSPDQYPENVEVSS